MHLSTSGMVSLHTGITVMHGDAMEPVGLHHLFQVAVYITPAPNTMPCEPLQDSLLNQVVHSLCSHIPRLIYCWTEKFASV